VALWWLSRSSNQAAGRPAASGILTRDCVDNARLPASIHAAARTAPRNPSTVDGAPVSWAVTPVTPAGRALYRAGGMDLACLGNICATAA